METVYDQKVIDQLRDWMIENHETISAAESVTSGHLQAALSSATEASSFFQGGITAYNLGQKTRHLHVEPISAFSSDCVHQEIASRMARSANSLFLSRYGLATTGYSSRVPEKEIHELFAFFAIAKDDEIIQSGRLTTTASEGIAAQVDYANQVLTILLKCVLR